MELDNYLAVAERAARDAGRLLRQWRGKFDVREKAPADLVTDADLAAQQCIRDILLGEFPDHGFLAEEEGTAADRPGTLRWIVDPLDGTTNYVHGVPFYAVSIGLEREGRPIVGVLYDPVRDACFRAAEGKGTWCGQQRLIVSTASSLHEALVVTSFPPGIRRSDKQVEYFLRVLGQAQSVRRTGSASLNLAYIAMGKFDAFWSTSLSAWDMAAGVLLVTEAGGRCTDLDGSPLRLEGRRLLATNGTTLHEEFVGVLRDADAGA
ncbi:MAG: inositol monophosphatase family protein [Pirellulales bacterium]